MIRKEIKLEFTMTFNESQDLAIQEAMLLNVREGSHKWKTVSMDSKGNWFADECECEEMELSGGNGCFIAPHGFDITLKVKFTETPICDWDKSVSSVPH
jgi:hypothetical protein